MTKQKTVAIQAPKMTEMRRKSDTENARTIAASLAWGFDEDDLVVDEQGKIVAYTIEDAAAAINTPTG
jgi:hypothetical protein